MSHLDAAGVFSFFIFLLLLFIFVSSIFIVFFCFCFKSYLELQRRDPSPLTLHLLYRPRHLSSQRFHPLLNLFNDPFHLSISTPSPSPFTTAQLPFSYPFNYLFNYPLPLPRTLFLPITSPPSSSTCLSHH